MLNILFAWLLLLLMGETGMKLLPKPGCKPTTSQAVVFDSVFILLPHLLLVWLLSPGGAPLVRYPPPAASATTPPATRRCINCWSCPSHSLTVCMLTLTRPSMYQMLITDWSVPQSCQWHCIGFWSCQRHNWIMFTSMQTPPNKA